jgi:hypothetical protein
METKFTNINVDKKTESEIRKLTKGEFGKIKNHSSEPAYVKFIKIIIIIIPIAILCYLVTAHFFLNQQFNYFYNIGNEKESFLTPVDRVSQPISDSGINFRNITSSLTYFNVPIEDGSKNISISIKFKDNLPESSKLILGAKDSVDWHYQSTVIYSPTIEKLIAKYPYKQNISQNNSLILIKLNTNKPDYSINDILSFPGNVRIATDQNISEKQFTISNYQPSQLTIDTAIRGTHNFYVYIKDTFEVTVEKRDMNWYENEDNLTINLYYLNNSLISSRTIKDDGETDAKPNKTITKTQSGTLNVPGLKEGVYRLELKNNDDVIITRISINQNKLIVKDKVFLASSTVYFNDLTDPSKLYFKSNKPITLKFTTYHDAAANQTIKIDDQRLKIIKAKVDYNQSIQQSSLMHQITSEKNDLLVSGSDFYSFTEDSWFEPFNSAKILLKDDSIYLENNADYVLVNYLPVQDAGDGWKISNTNIQLSRLYITDKKLNMLINIPHLANNATKSKYIPIDWINMTVFKPAKF